MKSRKGFTMVELLAVIAILGILFIFAVPAVSRWIDRSKKESVESQKQTLLMAGQSYGQANKNVLPKVIGETVTIKANDLKEAHYLKEDLKNTDKKSCMENSYVEVYKKNKTKYTYTAYLYCEGDVIPDEEDDGLPKPDIDITFTDDQGSSDFTHNVAITKLSIIINGSEGVDPPLGIDGYSYILSVKYTGEDKYVEIYNSGSLNGGGRTNLVIERSLRDYVDIRKASDFSVTVKAVNEKGKSNTVTQEAIYHDTTDPRCGTITGEAGEDEWDKNLRSRTISITCSDGDGAGCVKDTYTKTFDTEMKDGFIEIQDNAGNKKNCSVRVHLDWSSPTLTVTAYKRTSSGGKGAQVAQVTADPSGSTKTLSRYTGDNNGWLNSSFPYGIYYEFSLTDNVFVYDGHWTNNGTGIFSSSSGSLNKVKDSKDYSFNENNNYTESNYLSGEGLRRAKFVLKDRAGNVSTINIHANIDHTKPHCSTSKSNLGTEDGVTVIVSCGDGQSGVGSCPCGTGTEIRCGIGGVKGSRSFSVGDNAGNGSGCSVSVSSYDCHPYPYVCGRYQCGEKCYPQTHTAAGYADGGTVEWSCDPIYCNVYCTGYKTCYS